MKLPNCFADQTPDIIAKRHELQKARAKALKNKGKKNLMVKAIRIAKELRALLDEIKPSRPVYENDVSE